MCRSGAVRAASRTLEASGTLIHRRTDAVRRRRANRRRRGPGINSAPRPDRARPRRVLPEPRPARPAGAGGGPGRVALPAQAQAEEVPLPGPAADPRPQEAERPPDAPSAPLAPPVADRGDRVAGPGRRPAEPAGRELRVHHGRVGHPRGRHRRGADRLPNCLGEVAGGPAAGGTGPPRPPVSSHAVAGRVDGRGVPAGRAAGPVPLRPPGRRGGAGPGRPGPRGSAGRRRVPVRHLLQRRPRPSRGDAVGSRRETRRGARRHLPPRQQAGRADHRPRRAAPVRPGPLRRQNPIGELRGEPGDGSARRPPRRRRRFAGERPRTRRRRTRSAGRPRSRLVRPGRLRLHGQRPQRLGAGRAAGPGEQAGGPGAHPTVPGRRGRADGGERGPICPPPVAAERPGRRHRHGPGHRRPQPADRKRRGAAGRGRTPHRPRRRRPPNPAAGGPCG